MFGNDVKEMPKYDTWITQEGTMNLIKYLKSKSEIRVKIDLKIKQLESKLKRQPAKPGSAEQQKLYNQMEDELKVLKDKQEYNKMIKKIHERVGQYKFSKETLKNLVEKELLEDIFNCVELCSVNLNVEESLKKDLNYIIVNKTNALELLKNTAKTNTQRLQEAKTAIKKLKVPKVKIAPSAEEIATRGGTLKLVGYLDSLLSVFGSVRVRTSGSYFYDDLVISVHMGIEKLLNKDSKYFNDANLGEQIDKNFIKDVFLNIGDYIKNGTNKKRKDLLKKVFEKKNEVLKILTNKEKYNEKVVIEEETRSEKEIKNQAKEAAAAIKRLKSKIAKEKTSTSPKDVKELATRGGALNLVAYLEYNWSTLGKLRQIDPKIRYPYDRLMISLNKNLSKLLRMDPKYFDDENKDKIINKHFMKRLYEDLSDYVNVVGTNRVRANKMNSKEMDDILTKKDAVMNEIKNQIALAKRESQQIDAASKVLDQKAQYEEREFLSAPEAKEIDHVMSEIPEEDWVDATSEFEDEISEAAPNDIVEICEKYVGPAVKVLAKTVEETARIAYKGSKYVASQGIKIGGKAWRLTKSYVLRRLSRKAQKKLAERKQEVDIEVSQAERQLY